MATIFSLDFSIAPVTELSAVPLGCMFELALIEFFINAVYAEPGLNSLDAAVTGKALFCAVFDGLFLPMLPVAIL